MIDKSKTYKFLYSKYIPLNEGGGLICDCCGAIIANHVYLQDEQRTIVVGKDCAKTILSKDVLKTIDNQCKNDKLKFEYIKNKQSFYKNKFGFVIKCSKQMMEYKIEIGKIKFQNNEYIENI